jgi:hypothetical protein
MTVQCIVCIIDNNLQAFNDFSIVYLSSLDGGLSRKSSGEREITKVNSAGQ